MLKYLFIYLCFVIGIVILLLGSDFEVFVVIVVCVGFVVIDF